MNQLGDAQERAEAARDAMFAEDRVAHAMGMEVTAVGPGTAAVSMTVTETMCNGLDICHGGLIFTLADAAMAFACNAHGGSHLASDASIDWLAPGRIGDRLVATATETTRRGRTGLYQVEVEGPDGMVAVFRGKTKMVSTEGPAPAPPSTPPGRSRRHEDSTTP